MEYDKFSKQFAQDIYNLLKDSDNSSLKETGSDYILDTLLFDKVAEL